MAFEECPPGGRLGARVVRGAITIKTKRNGELRERARALARFVPDVRRARRPRRVHDGGRGVGVRDHHASGGVFRHGPSGRAPHDAAARDVFVPVAAVRGGGGGDDSNRRRARGRCVLRHTGPHTTALAW